MLLLTCFSLPQRVHLVELLDCDWEKRLHQGAASMVGESPLPQVDSPLQSPLGPILAMGPMPGHAPPSCLLKHTSTTRLTAVWRVLETLRLLLWHQFNKYGVVLCLLILLNCICESVWWLILDALDMCGNILSHPLQKSQNQVIF